MRISIAMGAAAAALGLAGCLDSVKQDGSPPDAAIVAADAGADAGTGWTVASTKACARFGGYNRIVIDQEYGPEPRCAHLVLVDPGASQLGVELPAGWGIELATLHRTSCEAAKSATEAQRASAATGKITLDQGTLWTVSLDTQFTFPADGALPAETVPVVADDVPLAGNCP